MATLENPGPAWVIALVSLGDLMLILTAPWVVRLLGWLPIDSVRRNLNVVANEVDMVVQSKRRLLQLVGISILGQFAFSGVVMRPQVVEPIAACDRGSMWGIPRIECRSDEEKMIDSAGAQAAEEKHLTIPAIAGDTWTRGRWMYLASVRHPRAWRVAHSDEVLGSAKPPICFFNASPFKG
ncbi:MAG: hypothetical protein V3U44_11485 [Alphaproteobacteria bacterium]